MKRALLLYGCLFLFGGLLAATQSQPPRITPQEYRRGEEQTILTFPEWFLVFSPDEYAQFVKHGQPSAFPFLGHVAQFWQSYAAVIREQRRHADYAANGNYHLMINIIGVSTTLEYSLRSAYETFIGRLAELTAQQPTAEDLFGARAAQEYVDFIKIRPWYEFDFASRLTRLWRDTPLRGDSMIRKFERRYALTTEYLVKGGYGWLLGKLARMHEEKPLTVTYVAYRRGSDIEGAPLPRYGEFTPASTKLATQGADFIEIAGNGEHAAILLTVLVPEEWNAPAQARVLFQQSILTVPGRKRVALVVPVGSLAATLRALHADGTDVEHVFDY